MVQMAPKGVQKGVLSPTEPCLRFPDLVNSDNSDPNLIKSDQTWDFGGLDIQIPQIWPFSGYFDPHFTSFVSFYDLFGDP